MKPLSVSGQVFYVKDLAKTKHFYQTLGFRMGAENDDYFVCYLNWYSLTFCRIDAENKSEFMAEATAEQKGAGQFTSVKVHDVDEFYEQVKAAGFKPSSEPRDWPWKQREFVLRDPDGYKLVLFQKL